MYHTPMQDPETVCNTRQTLMSSLNLQEERSSLKVQQENKKRRWLLFLFLPENSITTSTRLAQALISVGLIGGYHTYVNTHYWQINSIIFIIDSIFFQLYSLFPRIWHFFIDQKRHIPIISCTLTQFRKGNFWHLRSQFTFSYMIWKGFKSFIAYIFDDCKCHFQIGIDGCDCRDKNPDLNLRISHSSKHDFGHRTVL